MTDRPALQLTRDAINSGAVREFIRAHGNGMAMLSDEELTQSRLSMFPNGRIDGDVWIFGYGSLIWNPAIHFAEQRCGRVHGWHRSYCMRTNLGRGSEEHPGLMLALDRGGSCNGVAFRIPAEIAEQETETVWRREMVGRAYHARWLTVRTDAGTVKAIGFVMNRSHERYCGSLPEDQAAAIIDTARGFLGTCAEYLFNTIDHLDALGIPDSGLARIKRRILARRAASG